MTLFPILDAAILAGSPLIDPWRLRLAVCAAAGLLALVLAGVMIRMVWRTHWRSQSVRQYVHLRNRGNLASVLALGAFAPAHNLRFEYLLDGEVLAARKAAAAAPAPAPSAPAAAEATPAPEPATPQPAGPFRTTTQQAAQAAESAQEKAEKVSGISALLIDIVGTLGSILPGSLGQSLKDRSIQMQSKKAAVTARGQAPMRAVKQTQHLKESVGDLKDEVAPAGQAASPAPVPQGAQAASPLGQPEAGQTQADQAALPASQPAAPQPAAQDLPCREYVLLPALAPEASLRVELRVSPANPYFKGESSYWLFTLPQGEAPLLPPEALAARKAVQDVAFSGLSIYFWLLSALLSVAAVAVNGIWFYFFVRWIAYTFA